MQIVWTYFKSDKNAGPDTDPNRLTALIMVFWIGLFSKKNDFEKKKNKKISRRKKHEKKPSMQIDKEETLSTIQRKSSGIIN